MKTILKAVLVAAILGYVGFLSPVFSGVRDERFVSELHDAIFEYVSSENSHPISLSDFTDFTWDRLVVVSTGEMTSDVTHVLGEPWLKFAFVAYPGMGPYDLWIFLDEGWVVRHATVHSVYRLSDTDVQENSLLEIFQYDADLRVDEAVFIVQKQLYTAKPFERDVLFPIRVDSASPWRAQLRECIQKSRQFDECYNKTAR